MVFDPACGSGNFLVIAYKEMRAIEADINMRRGEPNRRSDIPLTNFRGIADFTLNGLSKLVGLPQMKLAWIVTKNPVPEMEIIADTYLSVSTPVQVALPRLLELREPVQSQIVERIRENAIATEAGWYSILPVAPATFLSSHTRKCVQ